MSGKNCCTGVCLRFKASRPSDGKRYAVGQKRCKTCDMFIIWGGVRCPCCNYKLKSSSKNLKHKVNKDHLRV